MPRPDMTVHTVPLSQDSSEYQDVVRKFQATACGTNIVKIERIQNPHLYKSYMVRKQKMDKDSGGNSELQLFHGTDGKNISHINTQGFNRSFCGAHGESEIEDIAWPHKIRNSSSSFEKCVLTREILFQCEQRNLVSLNGCEIFY